MPCGRWGNANKASGGGGRPPLGALDVVADSRVRTALTERTAWARSMPTPLREFLSTETGSAAVLLGATVAALAWANIDSSSYESVWHTHLSIRVGGSGISQDLRHWINNGLMTFFFFVVGLEVRREFDIGELRQRRRLALPVLAGLGGMAVPVAIYLAVNGGHASTHGWGVAMSTDTAFALGMLALVGPRFPDRLRAFMLTIIVVDDVVALLVIAPRPAALLSWRAFTPRFRRVTSSESGFSRAWSQFGACAWPHFCLSRSSERTRRSRVVTWRFAKIFPSVHG